MVSSTFRIPKARLSSASLPKARDTGCHGDSHLKKSCRLYQRYQLKSLQARFEQLGLKFYPDQTGQDGAEA